MGKKIFVLLIALIFFSSIIYVVGKDIKLVQKRKEENSIQLKEESENSEEFIKDKEIVVTQKNIDIEEKEEESNKNGILGTLKIDKINLIAEVKEGSSKKILENYIGHIEETSDFNGNVGLAAHNRGGNKNYFENLDKLEVEDEIIFSTSYGSRKYKIYKITEILDTDWTKFQATEGNELTLITCVNNKINVRLCVQAREI